MLKMLRRVQFFPVRVVFLEFGSSFCVLVFVEVILRLFSNGVFYCLCESCCHTAEQLPSAGWRNTTRYLTVTARVSWPESPRVRRAASGVQGGGRRAVLGLGSDEGLPR